MAQSSDASSGSAVPDRQRVAAAPDGDDRSASCRRLGVSERTVYRDIRDLILAGTPIDGEAGVGYRIRPGYDLPPLMFDRDEIQALVLGARIVRQFGDPALARASDAILGKVAAIVPKDLAPLVAETRLFVPSTIGAGQSADALTLAREALIARRKLELSYAKADGAATTRIVRPLGSFSGAGRGRWPPGANCVRISGTSGSIASRRPRCSTRRSRKRRARRSATCWRATDQKRSG